MLALTKKVDYSLVALCHLAQHRDRVATAREIAERYHLPQALLMNILKALAHAGVVRSSRGPKGGYELAVAAESVTLYELIEKLEGPVRLVQCAAMDDPAGGERCELIATCPISRPVRRLHRRLLQFLSEITLADIASDPEYGVLPGVSVTLATTGET